MARILQHGSTGDCFELRHLIKSMSNSHFLLAGAVVSLAVLPHTGPGSLASSPSRFSLRPIPLRIPYQPHAAAPHIRNRNGTSSNWSGYASETSLSSAARGAVNAVQG